MAEKLPAGRSDHGAADASASHPPVPAATGLPDLGRRGGGWVALQGVLIAVSLAAGLLGPDWPVAGDPWLDVAGAAIALAGTALLLSGISGLGRQLTPFPRPVADAELRRDGAYGLVRHPMYGGALLIVLGWALLSSPVVLLPLGLAAAFLDAKRRREEAWLVEENPEYSDYRLAVPRQFIPWVW